MPAQNIRVIYVEGSGVYGISSIENATLDAAVVSQAIGRPVKVQYTRADDHIGENYGTPQVTRLKGAEGSRGRGEADGVAARVPPSTRTRRGAAGETGRFLYVL